MNHILRIPVIVILTVITVLCLSSCEEGPNLPVVTTTSVSAITNTSATTGGHVTGDGGAVITSRGVVCGTASNPTIAGPKTSDGIGRGSFTSILTDLQAGTTHYLRAYATNSEGTAYGNQITFTTTDIPASGDWIINASFGTFTFTIDPSGTKIPEVYLVFSNWGCGPVTQSGGVTIKRDPPWPIEDGSFEIIHEWGGSFPSYDHKLTVTGTHDGTNQKFTGTWTHDSFGTICSDTWEANAPI